MATLAKAHDNSFVLKPWYSNFRLPQEHGATVAFICSTLLALIIAKDCALLMFTTTTILWIIFLSWHQTKQLIMATILGCLLLIWTNTPYLLVALLVLFSVTGWCMLKNVFGLSPELRECIGMLGAANIPILASLLISNNTQATLLASCALTASTLTCAGLIRFKLNGSLKKIGFNCVWALLAWMIFFIFVPQIALSVSIFFAFFQLWLMRQKNLKFKTLGIHSTLLTILTTLVVSAKLLL